MVSLVTPVAVAPPLLPPFQGSTHGGAYPLGTASLPVVVSHPGPQSTCLFWARASSNVSGGPILARAGALAIAVADPAPTAIARVSTPISVRFLTDMARSSHARDRAAGHTDESA